MEILLKNIALFKTFLPKGCGLRQERIINKIEAFAS
jgi:hypothetical protein